MALLSVNSAERAALLFFAPPVEVGEPVAVSVLDLWSEAAVTDLVYVTHPFVVQDRQRNRRKQDKRIVVFGEAEEIGGSVTFRMDGVREETYEVEDAYDVNAGILLFQECSPDMAGTVPEVEFNLRGKNIVLRDARLEMVILD